MRSALIGRAHANRRDEDSCSSVRQVMVVDKPVQDGPFRAHFRSVYLRSSGSSSSDVRIETSSFISGEPRPILLGHSPRVGQPPRYRSWRTGTQEPFERLSDTSPSGSRRFLRRSKARLPPSRGSPRTSSELLLQHFRARRPHGLGKPPTSDRWSSGIPLEQHP